jgi:hypothetical protein
MQHVSQHIYLNTEPLASLRISSHFDSPFDRKIMTRPETFSALLVICAATLLGGCATSPYEKEKEELDASNEKVQAMQRGMSTKEKDAMADACRKDTSNRVTGRVGFNTMLLAFNECLLRMGK